MPTLPTAPMPTLPDTSMPTPDVRTVTPPPLIQEARTSKRLLWFVVAAIVAGAIVVTGLVVALRDSAPISGDDTAAGATTTDAATASPPTGAPGSTAIGTGDTSPPSPPTTTSATGTTAAAGTTPPTATVPSGGAPDGSAGAVPVGTTVRAGGSLVRVNGITTDVPPDDLFTPDAGNELTAVEVEACAGPDGFASDPFYWQAFLADNRSADNFILLDRLVSTAVAPGGCVRGVVHYQAPAGQPIASIVLTDRTFSEIARWNADGAVAVTDRLAPEAPPLAVPVGQPIVFGEDHRATVLQVQDGAPPLDDFFPADAGRQFNRVTIEMCAGTTPLLVNALAWYVVGTDHWTGSSTLLGDTLPSIELAPGECAAGDVQMDVPAGTTTAYVVHADFGLSELGRWSVGG